MTQFLNCSTVDSHFLGGSLEPLGVRIPVQYVQAGHCRWIMECSSRQIMGQSSRKEPTGKVQVDFLKSCGKAQLQATHNGRIMNNASWLLLTCIRFKQGQQTFLLLCPNKMIPHATNKKISHMPQQRSCIALLKRSCMPQLKMPHATKIPHATRKITHATAKRSCMLQLKDSMLQQRSHISQQKKIPHDKTKSLTATIKTTPHAATMIPHGTTKDPTCHKKIPYAATKIPHSATKNISHAPTKRC